MSTGRTGKRRLSRINLDLVRAIRRQRGVSADLQPASDAESVAFPLQASLSASSGRLTTGTITWSGPSLGVYRVQVAGISASILCSGSLGSVYPWGVKNSSMLPAGTSVLIYLFPEGRRLYGVIVATLPRLDNNFDVVRQSDMLLEGMATGMYRDDCHSLPLTAFGEGGLFDFNQHSATDATTSGELAWTTSRGAALLLNDAEAMLRVNSVCGVFANSFDKLLRLAAWNHEFLSSGAQRLIKLDQGEVYDVEGWSPYFWELLGAYDSGQRLIEEIPLESIYFDDKRPLAPHDLPEEIRDAVPFFRSRIYRGYLGQGFRRMVCAPPDNAEDFHTLQTAANFNAPIGLFDESVSVTGEAVISSAKALWLVKRPILLVPEERKLPEDQKEGDGTEGSPYRFAGKFGDGPEHVHEEWKGRDDPEKAGLQTAAGVSDLLSRFFNWTAPHPFAMHRKDWKVEDEGSSRVKFPKNQENIDFEAAKRLGRAPTPEPVSVNIDHRFSEVHYFPNQAYLGLLDTGGVALGDGGGAEILLAGGEVFINGISLKLISAVTTSIMSGDDLVLKAKNSMDLSTTTADVRVKAKRNFHVLAGNPDAASTPGAGGIYLESRGSAFEIEDRIGEEMLTAGIVMRSDYGPVATLSNRIYFRTGGDGDKIPGGPIVFDAAKGTQDIISQAASHVRYSANTVLDAFGSPGQVQAANLFSAGVARFDSSATFKGIVFGLNEGSSFIGLGSVLVGGGHIFTSANSEFVGPLKDQALRDTLKAIRDERATVDLGRTIGRDVYKNVFSDDLYKPKEGLGDDQFQAGLVFSFRDTPTQYNTENFAMLEPRWMRLAREQGASLQDWKEDPVIHPKKGKLYPYPGRAALEGETLLQRQTGELTEPGDIGVARGEDGGPYRRPDFSKILKPVKLDENWKTL